MFPDYNVLAGILVALVIVAMMAGAFGRSHP